ncbi:hypothetical protein LTR36_005098 [Oleoguttula mirabilis]|uniref:Transcription initiation factor TFIID subunit 13 n=1 Tax=Oleoguttula mirabilis TaxID=1507867 RepID=A0AAV9JXJ4_9PEZI|nr:hypothetical protein LTR36_005098 [Oleoguttula mirabilis]
MAEPRTRHRHRGQFFSTPDLQELLYAFGDNPHPSGSLPTTLATLDEILTDFIIESCHAAALCASYSRRQKIKVDDFKWVLRKDERLLGRVLEQMWKDKGLKEEKRMMDVEQVGRAENAAELAGIAELGGVGGEMKKKGKRRKRKAEDEAAGDGKRAREA